MTVITLLDQLDFAQKCLSHMKDRKRPAEELLLQGCICQTIKGRIEAKANAKG